MGQKQFPFNNDGQGSGVAIDTQDLSIVLDVTHPNPGRQLKPRMTVIQTVYHHPTCCQPTSVESRYSVELESEEQVYVRRTKASERWQPVNWGWLGPDQVGEVVIKNEEGKFDANPTPEQQDESDKKVLELSFSFGATIDLVIHPKRSARFMMLQADRLYVRSQSDIADYSLTAFPK